MTGNSMVEEDNETGILQGIRGVHIGHINMRSLFPKIDLFRHLIEQSNIAVCGVSETWLNEMITSELVKINGFRFARHDRTWTNRDKTEAKKGGGLGIFIRDDITFSEHELRSINRSSKDVEGQWVMLSPNYQKKIIIGNLYRPPMGNFDAFIEYLAACLEYIKSYKNVDFIIMGDMNVNYLDNNCPKTKQLKSWAKLSGFTQLIDKPTRITPRKAGCLDLIFVNSINITSHGIVDLNISDHELVYVTKCKLKKPVVKTSFMGRSYKNFDENNFRDLLLNNNWAAFDNEGNVDRAWQIMLNYIRRAIDTLCPIKMFKINKLKDVWITDEILELIKDKDRAMTRAKRTGIQADWIVARNLKNSAIKAIRNAKAEFIKNKLEIHSKDSKKFWNSVSEIMPNKKKSQTYKITLKDKENDDLIPEDRTADYVNKYFTNIGPKLARASSSQWNYQGINIESEIPEIVTNGAEVKRLIKEIDINKSSATNGISSRVFKSAFQILSDKLTKLFNNSFSSGIFPSDWKVATIIPLPKDGDPFDVSNLRPVSLLPLPGKLIEKIVYNRLYSFFETNTALDDRQGGFRSGHSTINTVANFTEDIYQAINNRMFTVATFIDLQKAFDTVDHVILLMKLEKLGIKGFPHQWLTSYFHNRMQATLTNGVTSDLLQVQCGVPQGSILGSLMFLVYINDMGRVFQNSRFYLYADDTVVYSVDEDPRTAVIKVQEDVNKLYSWCLSNKLTINVKKTKAVIFGMGNRIKRLDPPVIKLGSNEIEYVQSYKYLGLTLDQSLTFNKHLNNVIRTASHKTYQLSKIRNYINEETSIRLYKTMILPYMDYGDIIYDAASLKQLNKLQKIQNHCLRIGNKSQPTATVYDLHSRYKVGYLEYRRQAHLKNFMFKQRNNDNVIDRRDIPTRSYGATIFNVALPRYEKYKCSTFYRGAIAWNQLPAHQRNIPLYTDFKYVQKLEMLAATNLFRR